jgi:hypothetical protein
MGTNLHVRIRNPSIVTLIELEKGQRYISALSRETDSY